MTYDLPVDPAKIEVVYRALVENSLEGMAILQDGHICFANQALADLTGFSVARLKALTCRQLMRLIHRDDHHLIWASLRDGQSPAVEVCILHADGDMRWAKLCFARMDYGTMSALQLHAIDITIRKRTDGKLREQGEQLRMLAERRRELAQKLIFAQEEERQRVARELHDEAGQALTVLKVSLEMIQASLPVSGSNASWYDLLRQRVRNTLDLCESTMRRMRHLAHSLRPTALDDLNLNLALEGLCRDFAAHTGLSIIYESAEVSTLSQAAELCCYRALQEALTNVAKHAAASRVTVSLRHSDHVITLSIEDDGIGYHPTENPVDAHGMGLLGMQERIDALGGKFSIYSMSGYGTKLTVVLPEEIE